MILSDLIACTASYSSAAVPAASSLVFELDCSQNVVADSSGHVTGWSATSGVYQFTPTTGTPSVDHSAALNGHAPIRFVTGDSMSGATQIGGLPFHNDSRSFALLLRVNATQETTAIGLRQGGGDYTGRVYIGYSTRWKMGAYSATYDRTPLQAVDVGSPVLLVYTINVSGDAYLYYGSSVLDQASGYLMQTPDQNVDLGTGMADGAIYAAWAWSKALSADEVAQLVRYVNEQMGTLIA